MNNIRNYKKIIVGGLLSILLAVVLICVGFGAATTAAVANFSPLAVAETENNFSKRSALVLQEEFEGGVHFEHNQWIQYKYDLTTLSKYDYIQISFESSSTVILFNLSGSIPRPLGR